jgi:hypothetical protein
MTKIGTRVIVTRAPTAPIEITHPKLFDPKKPTEQLAALGAEMVKGATGVADMPAGARPRVAAAAAPDGSTAAPIKPKPAVNLAKPISVFVSRKQRRVFVRRGFEQLFDLPIEIDHPDLPIGTHIFTAMQLKDDGKTMRWTAVSIPSKYPHHIGRSGKGHKSGQALDTEPVLATPSTAAEALDRITWPPDTIEQISSMLMVGSSLIVSDNALSDETGTDTDFIVLTP